MDHHGDESLVAIEQDQIGNTIPLFDLIPKFDAVGQQSSLWCTQVLGRS